MGQIHGLSSAEAALRLATDGPNSVAAKSRDTAWRLLLTQFTSPIVLILLAATVISIIAGDVTDGIIILCIIVPSGLLGFSQEFRAGKAMAGLLKQLAVKVAVIRDGVQTEVPLDEVVVGDLVELNAGDMVPADLKIIEAQRLMADESALTGESFPREKSVHEDAKDSAIAERIGQLFFGTHIVSGQAKAIVESTGLRTQFGSLASELNAKRALPGFERGIRDFGKLLAKSMLILVVAIFAINLVLHRPLLDSLLFSLALAVGLTPQLLPVIVSVSLAAGAKAMAAAKVLVKRLDAIEDFGAMTVLCTDKTGTLTLGVVELDQALDTNGKQSIDVLRLAHLNAKLQTGFANPLDEAILRDTNFADTSSVKAIAEIPYDFERRMLSVLLDDGTLITKGAFESVLAVSSLEASEIEAYRAIFAELSAKGNRVLGIATKKLPVSKAASLNEADEAGLGFSGFLVFQDPAKPDAAEAIAELQSLGIRLVLITGDNPIVAASLATKVGLEGANPLTGDQVAKLDDAGLKLAVETCQVFAEVDPLQKERIVKALQSAGHVVGYSGDGINDSAALKVADVGISVDTAVDVAKSAAAIVLLDRDLKVVAQGVRLGRKTFVNTMKYIRVSVSAAFGNVLSMAFASIFLPFLPLLPVQILLLNFMSDFPAVTISQDRVDEIDIAKPRKFDIRDIRRFMLVFGVLSSAFDLATFAILGFGYKASEGLFQSGWFVESTLTELVVMLVLRTTLPFWRSRPGYGLLISSVLLAAIVVILPFSVPGALIGLTGIPVPLLFALFGLIVIYAALNEIIKRWFNKRSAA